MKYIVTTRKPNPETGAPGYKSDDFDTRITSDDREKAEDVFLGLALRMLIGRADGVASVSFYHTPEGQGWKLLAQVEVNTVGVVEALPDFNEGSAIDYDDTAEQERLAECAAEAEFFPEG